MGPNWKVPCDEFVGFAHTMVRWPSAEDVSKGSENWKCARLSTPPMAFKTILVGASKLNTATWTLYPSNAFGPSFWDPFPAALASGL